MENIRVLICGIGTPIGLAMIRELQAYGVEVHGVAYSKRAIGIYSNALCKSHLLYESSLEKYEFIRNISTEYDIPYLMTVSESDIIYFNENKKYLPNIKLLIPDNHIFQKVLNKEQTYKIAQNIGISTPSSHQIHELNELDNLASKLSYPLILKWSNPLEVQKTLSDNSLPLEKALYCYSFSELYSHLYKYRSIGVFPLIQSFHAGTGLGQMIFMINGDAVLKFQHHRIHEWPPEGGISTLCKSIPLSEHEELMTQSVDLLRAIGWEGAAMVEYRHDSATGKSTLMEINGRFWGSLPLAQKAGVPFVWFTLLYMGLGSISKNKGSYSNIYCCYFIPEVKRLLRILMSPKSIMNKSLKFNRAREISSFLATLFNTSRYFYIFSFRDPKPALADIYFVLKKALNNIFRTLKNKIPGSGN